VRRYVTKKGCVTADEKKRYEWYCANQAIIQSSFDAYNAAFNALQEKDYDKAVKFFEYVISNIKLDKDGQLKKNNLTDKNIYNAIYRSAFIDGKNDISRTYSQKLIDMDYNDPLIYYFNAETYINTGDTTKALEVIGVGRNKFSSDKDLINYELNIYLKQNRSDVLLNKVNEALSGDPDNSTLIYVRGNIYDKFAADRYKAAENAQDEADKLERKAKNEKVPANKAKLTAQSKKQSILADSLMKEMRANATLAEADYKRKIELDPDNVDGHYAMGALLNNYENIVIVKKINKTTGATQQEYDKKIAALQKDQKLILDRALKHFTDALAIVENMPEGDEDKKREKKNLKIMVLESIKSVYKNMNKEDKFMEIKKQIDELE
jgi:ubiquitin